jgi:hypothetical protein
MSESVFVRWYGNILEGKIVNQQDKFGMVAVSVPIQGTPATVLYHPNHVYATMAEAQKPVDRLVEVWRQERPSINVSAFMEKIIEQQKQVNQVSEDWLAIQEFKKAHWDNERNMLQLDYWKEFELLWRHYIAKRRGMMISKPQQYTMDMERPMTEEEAMQRVIPSTENAKPEKFINDYLGEIQPRTIGKPITVTELSLF